MGEPLYDTVDLHCQGVFHDMPISLHAGARADDTKLNLTLVPALSLHGMIATPVMSECGLQNT